MDDACIAGPPTRGHPLWVRREGMLGCALTTVGRGAGSGVVCIIYMGTCDAGF